MMPNSNPGIPECRKTLTCRDIGIWMETVAPAALAELWDNVGWMAGNPDFPLSGVLVCLDVTEERVRGAAAAGLNLIVSHHPPIFTPMAAVTADTREGRLAGCSWQAGLQIFSAHTNFDAVSGGLADLFASSLKLDRVRPFPGNGTGRQGMMGRMGRMRQPCDLNGFLQHLRVCLQIKNVRLIGPLPERIDRVVTQNGAFDRKLQPFLRNGAIDVLVTGDVKYHDALDLTEAGIFTVDVGHFHSEKVFASSLADRMSKAFPGLIVRKAGETDVYTFR